MCVYACVYVYVCDIQGERDRGREGGRGKERLINYIIVFLSFHIQCMICADDSQNLLFQLPVSSNYLI